MEENSAPVTPASWPVKVVAGILALGVIGFGGYAAHEHNVAKQAEQQSAQVSSSLQNTNAQIAQLTLKLNDLEATRAAQSVVAPAPAPVLKHKSSAAHAVRRDDPRWKKMQEQIEAEQKQIDATQQNLEGAKTELSGSIAKTHDELVVLQKKGERNYYEFDLTKEKSFHPEGPVGIRLRKANTKHQYADLELLVDDRSLTQKHVNLMQPSIFYATDSEAPVEIVINNISKDHIHGYVSAPKYRRSELASAGAAQSNTAPVSTSNDGTPQLKTRGTNPN